MDIHRLQSGDWGAEIAPRGAELQTLCIGGMNLLWNAGPLWPRHAPLLFPIVGGLKDDRLQHQGTRFPMPKHGFARDRDFTWLHRSESSCALELSEDTRTLAAYPFPFRLRVAFELDPSGLRMEVRLQNPGPGPLPASFGLHPAFRWPLALGIPKTDHRLIFEADEPGPLQRLDALGLLAPEPHPTPIHGRELALREDLFAEDALILLQPRSRSLRFEAGSGPSLKLSWTGFPHLGLWAKPDPGPSFLCVEPWDGYASPAGWDGDIVDKPGGFLLAPASTRHWALTIGL